MALLAASLLVAFTAGFGLADARLGRQESPQQRVRETQDSTTAVAVRPGPEQNSVPPSQATPQAADDLIVGYVQWPSEIGMRLSPVFVGSEIDRDWLEANPPQVNQRVQRELSRAGWQAEPARRLVSVKLTGGASYTIPVDDVTLRYVGQQVF